MKGMPAMMQALERTGAGGEAGGAENRPVLERRLAQAEKFAAVGRLSGSLAHELASPLSVIGLRAAAIVEQTAAEDPAHQQALAIAQEVARVRSFMQALLCVTRGERLPFKRVSLAAVVEGAMAVAHLPADGIPLDVTVSMPPDPVFVLGDVALLSHALGNVVRNAVQALGTRDVPGRIEIRVRPQSSSVLIEVEDNGPGIAADEIAQLFEAFHTTKPGGAGMGLGLPISQGIVAEHGGEIGVGNRAEGGARVTIRLPCSVARVEDAA
jgi:two-component system, NtrC family, sensor kinase